MSVLVVIKVSADTDAFQKALADRPEEFVAVRDRGIERGAIHHRFGIGDGVVLVVDEWETKEGFEQFFGDPTMQEFLASLGAEAAPPEVTFAEALPSADEF
jgi:quinol monooxygenase YgiN